MDATNNIYSVLYTSETNDSEVSLGKKKLGSPAVTKTKGEG